MKHTSEQMQVAINEWRSSGLTKKAFCSQRNISYHTFHYWCKRLIEAPLPGFTQVSVQSHEGISRCEIIFPSGARMLMQGEPLSSWLREVVR